MKNHICGMHCSCWYGIGAFLWLAALVCLVIAWFATSSGSVYGVDAGTWYGNSLILAVLAIPLKLKRHASGCECGMCKE